MEQRAPMPPSAPPPAPRPAPVAKVHAPAAPDMDWVKITDFRIATRSTTWYFGGTSRPPDDPPSRGAAKCRGSDSSCPR
eukprot:5037801-Pyramimonas_sp.AAC.1